MSFNATAVLDVGTNVATLQTKNTGTPINLGGADAPGTLGLTDAELDRVKAGTLRIGRNDASASGNITFTTLIDLAAGANTIPVLHLRTLGNIGGGGGSVKQKRSGQNPSASPTPGRTPSDFTDSTSGPCHMPQSPRA
jgi:hypothetical protein